ncbi:MAG TPA: D-alanyl-D-alanine carboxypeptidase/D-alanyl-D-alanine-endopeptidase [Gemmatimonadaceae bacterium]|nr:D-alanyl-D-alanine carboxypeptidase/D-alanyl-D-alanine-endopeptidase [Gemmatimonadaceae bacterium]
MRRFAVLLLAFAACTPHTQGISPKLSAREALRHSIDSLASNPIFRNSNMGILIVNPRTGDTLYSLNAGRLFMPASNEKILTGTVALAQLGPDYRFTTTFASLGAKRDTVLDGDLIVIGRGDPTVSDHAQGKAMDWMARIADSLSARGIKRIEGSLIRGGNAFPDTIYGYGWEYDDLLTESGAPIDELLYDEGMTKMRTQIAGRDTIIDIATRTPYRTYLEALDSALVAKGIRVARGVSDNIATIPNPAPAPLFSVTSPPLRDILKLLEKPSQNQIAEILLRTMGLEKTGIGTADSGAAVVTRQLLAWGAERDGFRVYDGSGMSRHDLVSPETIVRALTAIQKDTAFHVFYDALPIAGVDGTLRTRMVGTRAAGNMRAKTGTLQFVRSLSGYITDIDGDQLVFSLLHNHFITSVNNVSEFQNQVGALLANYRTH